MAEEFRLYAERLDKTAPDELTSAPMLNKLARRADSLMDKATPRWGGGRIGNIISDLKKSTESFKETTQATMDAFSMFKPFMIDNEYLYRSDNVRALMSMIKDRERSLLPWYPERLDWYDYWLNVHFPGMRKWVLPALEESRPDDEDIRAPCTRHHGRVAVLSREDGKAGDGAVEIR